MNKTDEVKTEDKPEVKTEVKAEEKVVEETTQDNSPESEVPATEEQTTDEGKPDSEGLDDLPGDTEEQRRAFQGMRQEIKRLKGEKEERAKSESAFDVFKPVNAPQPQSSPIRVEDYQDSYTGEVDWNKYNTAMNNALVQTQKSARYEAQQTAQETVDENNARSKHPEVFANKDLEEEVAARWLFDRMNGKNTPLTKIAKIVSDKSSKAVSTAEKIGAEKMLNEVSSKEQASVAADGETSATGKQALSDEEFENLRARSRGKGRQSEDAIATRLKNIPYQE